jgi:succinoglycan biosynthesis protein ExoO
VEHAYSVPEFEPSPDTSREVLFVGNLYEPNVVGLRAFLEQVWPRILQAVPDARLCVCGSVCEAFRRPVAGASFEGRVDSLDPYYRRAAVVINPVPYGTGLKIKSVEALAYGRYLICTEAGAKGLGKPKDLPVGLVTVDETMARQVTRALDDVPRRHELEQRAWTFARTRFAPEVIYRELLTLLGDRG